MKCNIYDRDSKSLWECFYRIYIRLTAEVNCKNGAFCIQLMLAL